MTKAIPEVGIFGLVRSIAEDRFDAQPAREAEAIGQLLQEFARRSGDVRDRALAWIKDTHPWLYVACQEVPADLLATGLQRPELLQPAIEKIAKHVDTHKAGTLWDDLGFSTSYEDLSRQLYAAPGWKFLQEIRGEIRFAVPGSAWRDILEGRQGLSVKDDIEELMATLGVRRPDVRSEDQFRLWTRDDALIHIPPRDAALMIDAMLLRRRGAILHDDASWRFVRRDDLPNVGEANCFVMPVEAYHGMRGIARTVSKLEPERPGVSKELLTLEAAQKRLVQRGVDDPTVALVERDGRQCLMMTTEQARVLLKPADPNEARLARKRLEYDPRSTDFDTRVGELCVQAQKLSYEKKEDIRSFAKAWGLEDAELIDVPETDAQMLIGYDVDRNAIVVAPRGTESRADMLADANVFKVDARHRFGKGEVAAGFMEQFESLLPHFDAKFDEYRKKLAEKSAVEPAIVIGGHSLGGSLAAMLTIYLLNKGIKVHHVHTCGQPLTGDQVFANHAAELIKKNGTVFVRYINGTDPVPHMPANCWNQPLGFVMIIDEFGRMYPETKPPPEVVRPGRDLLSRLKRTVKNLKDGALDHRMDTYFVLLQKSLRSMGTLSVWD